MWLFPALAWLRPESWLSLIWIGGVGAALYRLAYLALPGTAMERRTIQGYARQFLERSKVLLQGGTAEAGAAG